MRRKYCLFFLLYFFQFLLPAKAEDRILLKTLFEPSSQLPQGHLRYTQILPYSLSAGVVAWDASLWSRYDNHELNLGALYRKSDDLVGSYGIYAYFDYMRMRYDSDYFISSTLGLEYLSPSYHWTWNVYLPMYRHQDITPTSIPGVDVQLYRPKLGVYRGVDASVELGPLEGLGMSMRTRLGYRVWHHPRLYPRSLAGFFTVVRWRLQNIEYWLGNGRVLELFGQYDGTLRQKRVSFGLEASWKRTKSRVSRGLFLEKPVYRDDYLRISMKDPDFNEAKRLANTLMDVYVINLDTHPERLERMAQMLDQAGLEYTRIQAVNGRGLYPTLQDLIDSHIINTNLDDPVVRYSQRLPNSWIRQITKRVDAKGTVIDEKINQKNNLAGHVGCTMSHNKALTAASKSTKPYAFILEDDAVFVYPEEEMALHLLAVIEEHQRRKVDADIITLLQSSAGFSAPNLAPVHTVIGGAHAYLVPKERMERILGALSPPYVSYYDQWWYWEEVHGLKLVGYKEVLFPPSMTQSRGGRSSTGYDPAV